MKFKNVKKKLPSNSRNINEKFKFSFPKISQAKFLKLYGGSLKIFVVLIFLLTTVIVGIDLKNNIVVKQNIDLRREKLARELKFWESFLEKNKNFKDAYFQASILEYKLGNTVKAKMYAEKGLSLDPNSEDGKKIERFLSK